MARLLPISEAHNPVYVPVAEALPRPPVAPVAAIASRPKRVAFGLTMDTPP